MSTLFMGLIVAFCFDWRTALVATGLLPLFIISGMLRTVVKLGAISQHKQTYLQTTNIVIETITFIRTILSLNA